MLCFSRYRFVIRRRLRQRKMDKQGWHSQRPSFMGSIGSSLMDGSNTSLSGSLQLHAPGNKSNLDLSNISEKST